LDESLKYVATFGEVAHFGALYKFNQSNGSANTAVQVAFGGEYAGLSVDAYYSKVKDAISASSLSAAQYGTGAAVVCPAVIPAGESCAAGASTTNTLAATVSDNTTYALMGLYNIGGIVKLSAGWERIQYANPSTPLGAGVNVAAYTFDIVNNAAYPNDKILQVYWAGVRYTVIPDLDLVAAYYGYHQNTYGTTANNAKCATVLAPGIPATCAGTTNDVSFDADYRLTKRFDVYAGLMYTGVRDGQASGYDYSRVDITTTTGVRFKF
jgi:predicted porin